MEARHQGFMLVLEVCTTTHDKQAKAKIYTQDSFLFLEKAALGVHVHVDFPGFDSQTVFRGFIFFLEPMHGMHGFSFSTTLHGASWITPQASCPAETSPLLASICGRGSYHF